MTRTHARMFFSGIFVLMVAVTVWASLEESVAAGFFHVIQFRWGWATLADAYCGFLTFYAWVLTREKTLVSRAAWFAAILILGNLAMSAYVLLQLRGNQPLFGARA